MKKGILILGVLGVSFSAVFVRFSNAPSLVLVLYRVLIATVLLLPVLLYKHRDEVRRVTKKDLFLCTISGLFLGLHFTAYFESLKYTTIASSVVLVDMEVFFVALAMLILFKERISKSGWIGIIMAFIGSVIIASSNIGSGSQMFYGNMIALLGALCMAVYTMIGRVCRQKLSTMLYTFIVYLASGITVLSLLIFNHTPIIGYEQSNLWMALLMAVFCTLLGHSIFSWGLKYEKASFIATIKLLEPVFASILGILIFQEIPSLQVIIGGGVVIFGIYWYSKYST